MSASQTNPYSVVDIAASLIKEGEGLVLLPYEDSTGHISIGYGRNLDAKGISQDEADFLFTNDLRDCLRDLEEYYFYYNQNDVRKAVLLDLRFNLGLRGLLGFTKMLGALEAGDYDRAAVELLDSRYARQVGNRALRNAELLRVGALEYGPS